SVPGSRSGVVRPIVCRWEDSAYTGDCQRRPRSSVAEWMVIVTGAWRLETDDYRVVRSSAAMPSLYDTFNLVSDYALAGDQSRAIGELVDGLERGDKAQVLLGVTGS